MRRLTLQFDLDAIQADDLCEAFGELAQRCHLGGLETSQDLDEVIATSHIENPRELGRLSVEEVPSLAMEAPVGEVKVRLEDVLAHIAFRRRLNLANLSQLRITKDGKPVELDPEDVAHWEEIGLTNTDFIHIRLLNDI